MEENVIAFEKNEKIIINNIADLSYNKIKIFDETEDDKWIAVKKRFTAII